MLFRHTVSVEDHELSVDHAPIHAPPRPFLRNIHHRQIQHFQKAVVRREYRFRFGHLSELAVEAFDGIRGINQSADGVITTPKIRIPFIEKNLLFLSLIIKDKTEGIFLTLFLIILEISFYYSLYAFSNGDSLFLGHVCRKNEVVKSPFEWQFHTNNI